MTVQCYKCKKIRWDGEWVHARPDDTAITHGYCPVCKDECYIELFSTQASRSTRGNARYVSHLVGELVSSM